ncbi:CRE-UGT-53 protein [Caenorhabditis remanei]|uniref:glucuronosyltransferase n=1 Tax=Caenorhabditis remanei TaxID=31234 RepID=E3LQ89_CAERE|nr:CRE-UGT-53 protein [Caenorhabditis remanei]
MRLFLLLITLFNLSSSLNILFYYAVIGPSHIAYLRTAIGKLLARGHTIDVVFAVYNELANLDLSPEVRRVYYNRHADPDYWKKNANHFSNMFEKTKTPLGEFEIFHESGYQLCRIAINDMELLEFLKSGNYDIGFSSDYDPCGNILMTAAEIPSIGSIIATPIFLPHLVSAGLPTIASVFGSPLYPENDGSLYHKAFNLLRLTYYHYVIAPDMESKYNKLIQQRFGNRFPDVAKIERDLDIVFVNSHEFLEKQRPMSSKIKYIGGMAIREAKKLPEQFENLLSASSSEFVLFSFGTQVPTVKMPLQIRKNFVEAFKKFPNVTFLWKYDNLDLDAEIFEGLKNIHRLEWLPQTELLHDDRVKLFISHMGLNSYLETATAGKPVFSIPLFADQLNNAQNARDREIGLVVDRDQLTVKNIESSLRELLENPKYLSNAKSISKMMAERPEKPTDVFINWLEFTAHNPGLHKVLRMPGSDLSPFYYYCGDILLILFSIVFLVMYFILKRVSVMTTKIKSD